jgi:methylated-DNA-[protein]-cysteine S-methyltransferase
VGGVGRRLDTSQIDDGNRSTHMTSLRHHIIPSPVGPLTIVADDADRLCGLYLPNHRRGLDVADIGRDSNGVIEQAETQLGEYFGGTRTEFDLPLATSGSFLEEHVWSMLATIPYATTTTYGEIAAELGLGRGAARAVGTANARNPISIILPCHRVVGVSGSLTGYAGGLEAKRHLLDLEAMTAGTVLFA